MCIILFFRENSYMLLQLIIEWLLDRLSMADLVLVGLGLIVSVGVVAGVMLWG